PVREEVEDRGGDERPHLDGRQGGDRLPHLGVVGELGDRVDEDPDHDQERDRGRDVTPHVALRALLPLAHGREPSPRDACQARGARITCGRAFVPSSAYTPMNVPSGANTAYGPAIAAGP